MPDVTAKVEWDRVPVVISFSEQVRMVETYGFVGSQGKTVLEGQRLLPRGRPSDTVYLFMHPATTLNLLPMPTALAEAGLHVLCCGSRYAKNDSALIMEKVVFDLGQYVKHAREVLGYKKIILVGWSGGGSLSLFYQAQAESPTITHTPAGDPYDLVGAQLQPADGVIFIAAHLSRAETLTEWLDPSLCNEGEPDNRNLTLDIYDPHCPDQPPYSTAFVARFRAAQLARNRRITTNALNLLDYLKKRTTARWSAASSCTGPIAMCAGSTRWSTRTGASRDGVFSAIHASPIQLRPVWRGFRRCAHGCRNGRSITPMPAAS
jgi:pimeloyl-ACP methyl ester carboxylesterase